MSLENLSYDEIMKYTKKELTERLDELEVPYDSSMTKNELTGLLQAEGGQFDDVVETYVETESYEVIRDFKDLKDKGYVYIKGDKYPRKENRKVKQERADELVSDKNKIGKQLIKERD